MHKLFFCLVVLMLTGPLMTHAQNRKSHVPYTRQPSQVRVVTKGKTTDILIAPAGKNASANVPAHRQNVLIPKKRPVRNTSLFSKKERITASLNSSRGVQKKELFRYARPSQARAYAASTQRPTSCSVDTILLTSQADIDNFSANYPSCTTPKYLFIDGTGASPAITNLNGLSSLNEIINKLQISNTSVTTLSPLNNLTLIGDTLQLEHNPLLTGFGLFNLDSVGSLIVRDLPALNDINGFTNNFTQMGKIFLDTTALTNLDGLSGLTSINGDLEIHHTPFTDLSGLGNLTYVEYINLSDNPVQTGLGLTNLTHMQGLVVWNEPLFNDIGPITYQLINKDLVSVFFYNTALTDFSGMDSAHSFINTFIGGNSNLTSLHGLEKLTSINYGVTIWYNPVLTDLTALSGIAGIDYDKLELSGNASLQDLTGLGNILNIGGGLWIRDNQSLTTLNGLNNNLIIHSNSGNPDADSVFITDNYQLALCSFQPLCVFLGANSSSAIIQNNASGCSSVNEVLASCSSTCTGLPAQTWTGNNSYDWNDPGNWAPAGIPGTCTKVTIPATYNVPDYPLAAGDISIGGLIMEQDAELDMDSHDLTIKDSLWMENASIYYGGNIVANDIRDPHVHGMYIEGNFSLLNYTGVHEFWFNDVEGNTVLSDNPMRTGYSSTFINYFGGNLTFINNSDAGNMYLGNASPGNDYVQGNLTVINNSSADISVGLGGGRPLKVQGDFIVDASDGHVDINNLTLTGGTFNPHTTQLGSNPIIIENLFMEPGGETRLDQTVYINNSLTFDNGSNKINTTNSNLLVLNSGAAVFRDTLNNRGFINGPMKKIGNTAFTFPLGKFEQFTDWFAPLTITDPANNSDEFTAEYFHHDPGNDGYDTSIYAPGFGGVQGREYWKLNRDNGNSKVKVVLSYDSARSGVSYAYQYMQAANWDPNLWKSLSNGGFTGTIKKGTLISADSTIGGPLTFSYKPVRKPVITMSALDTVHCQFSNFYVPFTLDTAMVTGNVFKVQLSDTLGNFASNATVIGQKITSNSDSVLCSIPGGIFYGKNYKIRITGNLPPDTSVNTRTVMFLQTPQQAFTIIGETPACLGSGIKKYYPSLHEPFANYTWTLASGGTFTTNGDTAFVTWTGTGFYNLTCKSSNQCGNGPQKILSVEVKAPPPTATPTIYNTGRWLFASLAPAQAGYQWYNNGTIIPGAINASYYASAAGNYTVKYSNYCGTGPASNIISFAANSIPQTINFPAIPDKTYGDAPFVPNATASSGLPVALVILSGPATINSQTNLLTITGTGLVTVKANQVGDNIYDTAAPVTRSFTVNQALQTITFNAIPGQDINNHTATVSASASSGLTVTFSILSGPATISGNTITLTGLGTVTVRASQAGDANYLPATNVDRSFCVNVVGLNPIAGYTNLCPGTATYTVNNIPGATYSWRIAGGGSLASTTNSTNVTWVTPGDYYLVVSASGGCGSPSNEDSLLVHVISSMQPDSVQSMLPANGAINQQLPLTLSWVPAHPNLYYTFDLYLWRADQSQPSTPYAANLTTVNYTIPVSSGLLSNQPYKWMIVSHNGSCTQINTGPVQQFTLIPLPDLQVLNVQAPTSALSGQTIAINWSVKNNGPGSTTTNQSWTDAVFLSFDSIPNFSITPETNPGAWNQLQFPIKPLLVGARLNVSALNSGEQYSNSINFTLPVNYSQPLYAYVIANYPAGGNAPQQVTYANDTARAPQAINVTLSPAPDLRVDTVVIPSTTFSGSTINLTYKVKNYGALTPVGSAWYDKVYLSTSPIFDINNALLLKQPKANGTYYSNAPDAAFYNNTQLQGDSSYTRNVQVVVPNYIFGTYFIYVFTNSTNSLYEGALNGNNLNSALAQVFLTPTPHLTVNSLILPGTTASTTQPLNINWNISNTGFNDNIEKNKGHYFIQNGTCVYSSTPATVMGITLADSVSFGSSYWLDRVYLSTDGSGLNTNTAILINETTQGILNSGLSVPDNYTNPLAAGCQPVGTNGSGYNNNTSNVIKSGSNHPKTASVTIPDDLQPGNYYVYVLTNATKTVYEYPGNPETKRSTLPISIQRPDAVVSAVSVPANTSGGQSFGINYSILNNGPGTVFNHVRKDRIYVSSAPVFDGSAQLISTQTYTEDLPVGTAVPHTYNYSFPGSTSGVRYFYVHTNFDSAFRETNMNNNISSGASTLVSPGTPSDLQVSSIQLADTVYSVYSNYLKYTVTNSGAGTASGTWIDSIFISCSPTFSAATAYYLAKRTHNETMTSGQSYSDSFNFNMQYTFLFNNCFPQTVNTTAYYFIKTNANNVVYEGSNTNNNVTGTGSRLTINPLVDHIVTSVTGADTATAGHPYVAGWTVKNIGYNPGPGYYQYWYDRIYFSPDSTFNGNAVPTPIINEGSVLNTNQSYTEAKSITAPNLSTGDYYVFAGTNVTNSIPGEKVLSNNFNLIRDGLGAAKKIHLVRPLLPDLVDSILYAPPTIATGQPLTIIHRVTNIGAGETYPFNWSDKLWLSSDFVPGNGGDIQLSGKNHVGTLLPGQYYDDTITSTIPLNTTGGTYVLISNTNATANVFELNSNNNLAFQYITVYRPAPSDLVVENITKPDTVYLGYPITTASWVVRNISSNTATGFSSDGIYLSSGTTLDSNAVLLGIKNKNINIGPLAGDTVTMTPLVTNVPEGNYNVLVRTDLLNNIYESDKTNNTGISATPVYVAVKELQMNVPELNTLFNIDRFYKLEIPDSLNGSTILVTLKSNDSLTQRNQMFIGKGYIPSAAHFDYTYSTPDYGNQQIIISSVTQGTYYITIRNVSANPVTQNITLRAEKLPFAILSVHTNSGGNIGNVTIKITGSLFSNDMTAKLSKPGTTITATSVYYTNSTTVYATFNLQGRPLGIYDVTLAKPDTSMATLANGFSVVNANNGGVNNGGGVNTGAGNGNAPGCNPGAEGGINTQLVTEMVLPDKVFGGWVFVIQINYSNPTNTDAPAQTRILYSLDGLPLALTQAGTATGTNSLYLELTEQDGPPGIIRAGGSGSVTVYSKAPVTFPAHQYANFVLK